MRATIPDDDVVLAVEPPFDLRLTVEALRRRPSNLVERYEDGEYRRLLWLEGQHRVIAVRQDQVGTATVRARALDGMLTPTARTLAMHCVERMLGLNLDLAPVWRRIGADARLTLLGAGVAGLKPPRFANLWETVMNVVPFQQVSLDAGIAIVNRVVCALGVEWRWAGRTWYGFPTAEVVARTAPTMLRSCGLSAAKTRTLLGLARLITAGALSEWDLCALGDAAALTRLTSLAGIGPWSASLILLRGLGRLSVFPPGDSGAARNLRRLLDADEASSLALARTELLDALGPYQGYLYFMLLGQSLRQRGIEAATDS